MMAFACAFFSNQSADGFVPGASLSGGSRDALSFLACVTASGCCAFFDFFGMLGDFKQDLSPLLVHPAYASRPLKVGRPYTKDNVTG